MSTEDPLITRVRDERLTYLTAEALADLAEAVDDIERRGTEGIIVEAGAALGGSAVVLATAKAPGRALAVYDVFGSIPPPSDDDDADVHERYAAIASGQSDGIAGDVYYGYRENLYDGVVATFRSFGFDLDRDHISLVQGRFEETMNIDRAVALAHLDCDWYRSVMTCLRALDPWMVSGGRFIVDDYDDWSGCRKAVDDFLAGPGRGRYETVRRARLQLVKR